jgi:hypothetical protein
MASIINALSSGTGGIVTSGDASGILQLQTANTAAVTIDGSQNVGIGTASPTQKLQVAGNAFISAGQYFMWDNAGAWSLQSDASTYVRTYINGNEKMRVNAYGIGVGGAIPSSGTGITFPATQSASSDANTLDDYEEGTFTATMSTSSSGSVTIDTSFRTGWYTKIGRQVTVLGQFKVSSVSSPAGELYLNGLPFTSLSAGTNHSAISIICDSFTAGATTEMTGYISPNGTTVAIGRFSAGAYLGGGAGFSQAGSYFFLQATYFTA